MNPPTESVYAKLTRMIEDCRQKEAEYPELDIETQELLKPYREGNLQHLSLLLLVQTMGKALEEARIDMIARGARPQSISIIDLDSALLTRDETIKELR